MSDLRGRLAALDAERRRYTLETLASHLVEAGRTDRLHSLFDDAQWLHARYEGSGSVYDGYVLDLDFAWEDAQDDDAFARCFRYALIRSSLNSLSGSLPPELVIRIVETGLWPTERALSVSAQVPEPERRARLLALLQRSGKLNDLQEARVRGVALAALAEIEEDDDLVAALREWVPLLDESDAVEVLNLAERVSDGSRALALAQAAALSRGSERDAIITRALVEVSEVLEFDQPEVYGTLAPFLGGELADRAVAQARALRDENGAEALAKLAAGLPDGSHDDLFEESLRRLEKADDKNRAYALRVIESFPVTQRPALAASALELARRLPPIDREYDIPQIVALSLAAPYLDERRAEEALALARDFPRIDYLVPDTVAVLVALAQRLPEPGREEVLREALERATNRAGESAEQTESDEDWANVHSVESLVALAKALPEGEAAPLLEQAVAATLSLPDQAGPSNQLRTPKADALVQLAPLLPPRLLERVLAEPPTIRDHLAQCLALARLAPSLGDSLRATALEAAVRALVPIEDEDWRKQGIAKLAPLLPDGLMQLGLDAANAITWDLARGDALAELAPYVPDRLVDATLAAIRQVPFEPSASAALLALIPRLPESQMDNVLDTAWRIDWEPGRTKCVVAIAGRLVEPERGDVLRRALTLYESAGEDANSEALTALASAADEELALALWPLAAELPDFVRENAFTALAPRVPADDLVAVVDSLPALGMDHSVIAAVAPRLDGELLARTLAHLYAMDADADGASLALAIEVLAPLLDPEQVEQTLDVVSTIPDGTWRCVSLEALIPKLAPPQLGRAEAAALGIDEGTMRARALTALIPHLDGDARERVMSQALAAARHEHEEAWARAVALAKIVPFLDGDLRTAVIDEAIQLAAPTANWQHLSAYASLAAVATGSQWEAVVTKLLTGVADAGQESETLEALAVPSDDESLAIARRLLITHARRLRTASREELLTFVANVSLFSPEVVDVQALDGLARNVIEICTAWEWA